MKSFRTVWLDEFMTIFYQHCVEYAKLRFSPACIYPCKDRAVDSENTVHQKKQILAYFTQFNALIVVNAFQYHVTIKENLPWESKWSNFIGWNWRSLTSVSTNEIILFRFPLKIFLKSYKILENTEINENISTKWMNPFHFNVPFLYPLKTSENQRFLTFTGVVKIGHWREKG